MFGKDKDNNHGGAREGAGRKPSLDLNEANLRRVRALASLKCTHREMAVGLEVSYATWNETRKRHPEFQDAYEDGWEGGNISLRRDLINLGKRNGAVAKLLATNYLGLKDQRTLRGPGPGGSMPTFDLSGLSNDDLDQLERLARRLEQSQSDSDGASETGSSENA